MTAQEGHDPLLATWRDYLKLESSKEGEPNQQLADLEHLLALFRECCPDLLTGKEVLFTPKLRKKITAAIEHKGSLKRQERTRDLLGRMLEYGEQHLGWKNNAANTVAYHISRDTPVLLHQHMVAVSACRSLIAAYHRGFERLEGLSKDAFAGMVLFSAIVDSALLGEKKLAALLQTNKTDWVLAAGGLTVELRLIRKNRRRDSEEEEDYEAFRFLPTPLTELLLYRYWHYFPEGDFPVKKGKNLVKPYSLIRGFFNAIDFPVKKRPASLRQLTLWVEAWLGLEIPPFLLTVLRGRYRTAMLPAQPWLRFASGLRVKHWNDQRKHLSNAQKAISVGQCSGGIIALQAQIDFLSRISRLFQGGSKKAVAEKIRNILAAPPTHTSYISWLIGSWAYYLIRFGGRFGKRLKWSSIRRYMGALKSGVLPAFADVEAESLDATGWLYHLQQAIDNATDKRTPDAVARFAEFLQLLPDFPKFDVLDLEGIDNVYRINANLISVADFEKAVQRIEGGTANETEMCALAAALAFYAGLRRAEVTCIRLCDLQGMARPSLLVRGNQYNSTKSTSSQRVLPLYVLLPDAWLVRLQRWREKRIRTLQDDFSSELLFCQSRTNCQPLPADGLIDPVVAALREQTADEALVFHHLRHSFANWVLIRLILAERPELDLSQYQALNHLVFEQHACRDFRHRLLQSGNSAVPVRHALYALSILMGHKSPEMTLGSYIHLTDVILHALLSRKPCELSDKGQQTLLGFKPPAKEGAIHQRWYRYRKTVQKDGELLLGKAVSWQRAHSADEFPNPVYQYVEDSLPDKKTRSPETRHKPLRVSEIHDLLLQLYGKEQSIYRISREQEYSLEDIDGVRRAATWIHAQRTHKNHPRFHLIPSLPHNEQDRALCQRIFTRIEQEKVDIEKLVGGLNLFLFHADPSHSGRVLLRDMGEEEGYLTMLLALGLDREEIICTIYHTDKKGQWAGKISAEAEIAIHHHKLLPEHVFDKYLHVTKRVEGQWRPFVTFSTVSRRRPLSLPGLADKAAQKAETHISSRRGVAAGLKHLLRLEWHPGNDDNYPDGQCTVTSIAFDNSQEVREFMEAIQAFGIPRDDFHLAAYDEQPYQVLATELNLPFLLSAQYGPLAIYVSHDEKDIRQLEWGATLLAAADPKQHMRIPCRSRGAVKAAMAVLEVFGVPPDRLAAEITPASKQQTDSLDEQRQLAAITRYLIADCGIPEAQIHIKRQRKSTEARNLVHLNVLRELPAEPITAYGLRFALQMLACYLMATGQHWPQRPVREML